MASRAREPSAGILADLDGLAQAGQHIGERLLLRGREVLEQFGHGVQPRFQGLLRFPGPGLRQLDQRGPAVGGRAAHHERAFSSASTIAVMFRGLTRAGRRDPA